MARSTVISSVSATAFTALEEASSAENCSYEMNQEHIYRASLSSLMSSAEETSPFIFFLNLLPSLHG